MSKFYGQVGDPYSSRTDATRCGSKGIRTSAQSWDGSVIIELDYGQDGELRVVVRCADGSSSCTGDTVYNGSFNEFKADLLSAYIKRVNG